MQSPARCRRSCFIVAAVVGISGCTSAPAHSGHVSLDAACHGSSHGAGPHIKATIRNGTLQHLSIVAGIIVGDGEHLAQALSLVLKRPEMTEGEMYGYAHPRHPGVGGRVDAWTLELFPGGSASLDVDAQHFLSAKTGKRFLGAAERGNLTVLLRGLDSRPWPGLDLARPWTGVVESPPIRLPESCDGG
jgi:hypothetical protein